MKTNYFKRFFIAIFIVTICGIFILSYINLSQTRKLNIIIDDLSDYYYISCPNGNELQISKLSNMKYKYDFIKYSFDLTENDGVITYESETTILGNTSFYRTGLLSGSTNINVQTNFPQCVIEKNDASLIPRFFHPSYTLDGREKKTDGGKIYISFKQPFSYNEVLAFISICEEYGTVTWLWVDTYKQINMDNDPITIQNPIENDVLPIYGIPLYHNGSFVEDPLNEFLDILNNAYSSISDNYINEKLKKIKFGINNSDDMLRSEDIKIIGVVLLPFDQSKSDREEIFQFLNEIDNVKICT